MKTSRWIRRGTLSLLALLGAACGQYAGVHDDASSGIAPAVVDQGVAGVELQSEQAQAKGLDQEGAGGLESAQIVGNVASTGSTQELGELLENLPELPGTATVGTKAEGSESGGSDETAGGTSTTSGHEKGGAATGGGKASGEKTSGDKASGDEGGEKGTKGGTTVGETGGASGTEDAKGGTGSGSEEASSDDAAAGGSTDGVAEDSSAAESATDDSTADDSSDGTSSSTATEQDPSPEQLEASASYIDSVTAGYVAHNVTVLPAGFPFVICPVQGHYGYSPGFGDLRCVSDEAWCGGFHYHQGVDIFADQGTPIVAPFDGYVEDATNYVGGTSVRVRGVQGYVYNAHLVAIRKEVVGQFVPAGTVVGWVGNTGNAVGTSYHDHFEWHPDYGDAIDPFPYLLVVCPPS